MRILITAFSILSMLFSYSANSWGQTDQIKNYQVPSVNNITIDGNPADWKKEGLSVNILTTKDGQMLPPEDFDICYKVAWNEKGLLILAEIQDDINDESEVDNQIKNKDCLQIYLVDYTGDRNYYHVTIAPGNSSESKPCRYKFSDHRGPQYRSQFLEIEAKSKKLDQKQYVEILLPWSNLSLQAKENKEFGLQLSATDYDGKDDLSPSMTFVWYPGLRSDYYAEQMYKIQLVKKSDEDFAIKVDRVVGKNTYKIIVNSSEKYLNKNISIVANGKLLAEGKIKEKDGRYIFRHTLESKNYKEFWPAIKLHVEKTNIAKYNSLLTINNIFEKHSEYIANGNNISEINDIKYSGNFVNELSSNSPPVESFPTEAEIKKDNDWMYTIQESDGLKIEKYIDGKATVSKNGKTDILKIEDLSDLFWCLNPYLLSNLDSFFKNIRMENFVNEREGKFILIRAFNDNEDQLNLYFDVQTKILQRVNGCRIVEYKEAQNLKLPSVLSYNRKGGSSNYYWEKIEGK